jgi:hypothetical protein
MASFLMAIIGEKTIFLSRVLIDSIYVMVTVSGKKLYTDQTRLGHMARLTQGSGTPERQGWK